MSKSGFCPQPTDGSEHVYALWPQSITDSWDMYCSCGWRSTCSLYEFTRDTAIAELERRVKEHAPGGRKATHADFPQRTKSNDL